MESEAQMEGRDHLHKAKLGCDRRELQRLSLLYQMCVTEAHWRLIILGLCSVTSVAIPQRSERGKCPSLALRPSKKSPVCSLSLSPCSLADCLCDLFPLRQTKLIPTCLETDSPAHFQFLRGCPQWTEVSWILGQPRNMASSHTSTCASPEHQKHAAHFYF